MSTPDSFAARMKGYEEASSQVLVRRLPVIIRVDGKNFSKLSNRLCEKPFDRKFTESIEAAAHRLCKEAQNVRLAYFQSDEISILMTDYRTLNTDPWFDNSVQKISSVSAGIATAGFLHAFVSKFFSGDESWPAFPSFDARCFNLPREEVTNYFIWRQRDAERNSISMTADAHFSHSELHGQNREQKMDMLMLRKGINWNDLDPVFKRGACVVKRQVETGDIQRSRWVTDWDTPIFARDRDYVERHVREEESPPP